MSTRYIRSNRKSKSRILSLLIADDGGIEKAAVAALDSDQVISVINETGSGFDSDQVVAIIDENPSHPTISAASSVNNAGNTFIQDITLDSNGHITNLTSATATSSAGGGTEIVSGNLLSVSPIAATNPAGLGGQARNHGIFLGSNAGTNGANTDADYQIFLGHEAGYSANTSQNAKAGGMIGIGKDAGKAGGIESVYIGYYAGRFGGGSSIAYYNVSLGAWANYDDKGVGYNVAIGHGAIRDNNTGWGNTAVGYQAMGHDNIGSQDPHLNVAIGYRAGFHVTGNTNVFIGREAGGQQSASYPTSGSANIFMGNQAGKGNTSARTGSNNVFIGTSSGDKHTTGNFNVAMGTNTAEDITTGHSNVILGALNGVNVTSGYQNVFIGYGTGYTTITGYNNIYIGYSCNGQNNSRSGEIVIGYSLTGKGNNTAYMGSTSNYNPGNNSSWNTTSDERIKTNVTNYTNGLTILDQINVKTYNYLSDSDIAAAHPELADSDGLVHEGLDTEKTIVGLMAQDLETLLPNSVTTRENGIKSVNKDELFWVMLNSIKELKALNDVLTTSNEALTVRVEALENN